MSLPPQPERRMRNLLNVTLALILGIGLGSGANIALVMIGPSLIALPPGADMTTAEGIKAALPLLEPKHFLFPFLAHAVGTLVGVLVGALACSFLVVAHRARIAYAIGIVFLCGGIAASFMIPAPSWFIVLDLVVAYVPMAWLGLALADRLKPESATGASAA